MSSRPTLIYLWVPVLGGMLAGVPARAAEQGGLAVPVSIGSRATPVEAGGSTSSAALPPASRPTPLAATDKASIESRWGIRIESLRLTAAGYMLDFRYRVIDAAKAAPLFERKTKPILRDEASGVEMVVPEPPTTGAMRNSNDPKEGRTYFMFFGNPGRYLQKNSLVTVTIGAFSVRGLTVR